MLPVHALVLMGPPGAGKGTQSHAIAKEFGVPEISTGLMLREAVQKRSAVGIAAKAAMESGKLVPDELVCRLIEQRITEPDAAEGLIVDGFPRNIEQAVFWDRLLGSKGWGKAAVINIRVDRETVLKRLSGRRVCPVCGASYNIFYSPPKREGLCDREGNRLAQRPDDNEEVIRRRLSEYERQTEPVIHHYREAGLLREVDGNGAASAVTDAIFRILRDA